MSFFSRIIGRHTEKGGEKIALGDGYTFRDKMFNTVCIRQLGKTLSIAVTAEAQDGRPGARTELTLDEDGVRFLDEFLKSYINTGSIAQVLSILTGGVN